MMRSSLLLLAFIGVVLSVSSTVHAINGKCRALALAGGGDKAAYETGVVGGLLNSLPAIETSYDVVTGISAGSTLTAAFSVYPIGSETEVAQLLMDIISDLNQSSIYQQWPGGIIEGFLYHSSIFDSTPLRNLATSIFAGMTLSPDRVTCMSATNMNTGVLQRFCDHESVEAMVNATIASAAIPGVFLAQTIGTDTYIDGGTVVNVDVTGAVLQCLNLGYNQSDIIIDTVECHTHENVGLDAGDLSHITVLPVLLRALKLNQWSKSEVDYAAAVDAFPQVNFRYRIFPSVTIPGSGISFNQTQMLQMEALGRKDAAAAVAALPPNTKKRSHNVKLA